MNKKEPKVSIIIPVYNGKKYVKEAIDSALAQTYSNIEIIVINDGSTDETEKILKSYGTKIKYYSKKNGGVSTALNLAISKMTGDYFSWLSHDDRYLPNKIEAQITYLKENQLLDQKVILYSNFDAIDKHSKFLWNEEKDDALLLEKPRYALLRGAINGITMLIPKQAFKECGLFDETLRCTQDYELWNRMIETYRFIHLPQTLAESRFHAKQVTNSNPKVVPEGNATWIKMIQSVPEKERIALEGSNYAFYDQMRLFLKKTEYREAERYCEEQGEKYKNSKKEQSQIESYQKRIMTSQTEISQEPSTGPLKKVFKSIHTVGLKKTLTTIKQKVLKKESRSKNE